MPFSSAVERPVALAGLLGAADPWQVWPATLTRGSPGRVLAEVAALPGPAHDAADPPRWPRFAAAARTVD